MRKNSFPSFFFPRRTKLFGEFLEKWNPFERKKKKKKFSRDLIRLSILAFFRSAGNTRIYITFEMFYFETKAGCCFATWDTRLPRNRFNFKNARYSTYLILPGPGYAGYFETFFKLFRKRTEGNVGYDDTDSVRASFMKVLFQRSTRCPSVRQRC